MAQQVQPSDVKVYKGATNIPAPDDAVTSIGGAISATEISDVAGNILVEIAVNKTAAKTRYTKVFIKNTHGTLTMTDLTVYLSSAEPTDHQWELGKAFTASDTTTQGTAPASVSFTAQDGTTAGRVTLGNLAPGASVGVWLKLILGQNAVTQVNIQWTFLPEWV